MASKRVLLIESVATSGTPSTVGPIDVSSISDAMILLSPVTENLTAVTVEADVSMALKSQDELLPSLM